MRGKDNVRKTLKLCGIITVTFRFIREYINSCTCKSAVLKSLHYLGNIQDKASRQVDQKSTFSHLIQLAFPYKVLIGRIVIEVERYHI